VNISQYNDSVSSISPPIEETLLAALDRLKSGDNSGTMTSGRIPFAKGAPLFVVVEFLHFVGHCREDWERRDMRDTLRRRLIISHMLPVLVIIPMIGIVLIYVLEAQVAVPNLTREMVEQAALVAELTRDRPTVWTDATSAQDLVRRVSRHFDSRLMLLDQNGRLLASSDAADAGRIGQVLSTPELSRVLSGETVVRADYFSPSLKTEIADVWQPVSQANQSISGIVRLSFPLSRVFDRFLMLRYIVTGVLIGGIVAGAALGWVLALNLERPLRHIAEAIRLLAQGEPLAPLSEKGPEEITLLARALNVLVERLHDLEDARRHLLASLVHELGRPLGALRSATEALRTGADRDEQLRRELLSGIDEELRLLQRLLEDLAHLYDQVLGLLELNRQMINLSEWLPTVLTIRHEAALQKGLRWETHIPAELPVIYADPERLAQALGNLLNNALKYTPNGGTVSVSVGVEGDDIWFRVSDTGPGIAPQDQARIFEPFYRGKTLRRSPQGLGLGLTIAHDLVAAHGGRIDLDSAPGLGSRFTIHLPRTPGGSQR
jgi:signal transduction histidine kinase